MNSVASSCEVFRLRRKQVCWSAGAGSKEDFKSDWVPVLKVEVLSSSISNPEDKLSLLDNFI